MSKELSIEEQLQKQYVIIDSNPRSDLNSKAWEEVYRLRAIARRRKLLEKAISKNSMGNIS